MPQPDRACSGYLLQTGESLSLFDCGGGVTSSFLRRGFDPMKLDRIFISHTHSDHVAELSLFIQMLHGLGYGRKLKVYLPEEFVAPFEAYLPALYLIRERLRLDLDIRGYGEGKVYEGDFSLSAIPTSHHEKIRSEVEKLGLPNRMESFAFKIEAGEKSVLYSADLGSFDDIRDYLADVDFAIVETTHVVLDELYRHASGSTTVGAYVLTHLGNGEEVALLRKKIEASGLKNVLIAEDGMRLDL